MVFKRVLGSLGVGGPFVATVLDQGAACPGGVVRGKVRLRGGGRALDIEHIALELIAGVEAERGGQEPASTVVFDRLRLGGGFHLDEREHRDVPFTIHLPWETPATELAGQPLGIALGVRAELTTAGAMDRGDPEQLIVHPLPAEEAVLGALGRLGFSLVAADLELGRIPGSGQTLPFHQVIALTPAPRYLKDVNEIALTLLAGPGGVEVVLGADRRGRRFSDGSDALSRHTVSHEGLGGHDWTAEVDSWIQALVEAHSARASAGNASGRHDRRQKNPDVRRRSVPGTGAGIAGMATIAGMAGFTAGTAVGVGVGVGVGGSLVAAGIGDALGISGNLENLQPLRGLPNLADLAASPGSTDLESNSAPSEGSVTSESSAAPEDSADSESSQGREHEAKDRG